MLAVMLGFAVVLFPIALMLLTLAMARLEARLGRESMEDEVGEFLDHATSGDVDTLVHEGMGRALDVFLRRRHRALKPSAARRTRVG